MKYSKLSVYQIKKILKCFSDELTAVQTAKSLGLHRNTIDRFFQIFREDIAEHQERNLERMSGNIEIDESYFGSTYRGDKRGRSTQRKIPVVGLLKRNGIVYTKIIPNASRSAIWPTIHKLVDKSKSNVYTDKWRTYDGLVFQGYKHYRINHSKEFAKSHNHINGIESFWSYVKRKMRKHNGISRNKFYLYLKESEFRFNNRQQDIYKLLLKIVLSRIS
jgi:transposase-like protein